MLCELRKLARGNGAKVNEEKMWERCFLKIKYFALVHCFEMGNPTLKLHSNESGVTANEMFSRVQDMI